MNAHRLAALPPCIALLALGSANLAHADEPAPKVTLVSAGSGAKAPLRYTLKKGKSAKLVMESDMAMRMQMGDQAGPAMTMPTVQYFMTVQTDSTTPKGDASVTSTITKIGVVGDPAMTAPIEEQLTKLTGTKAKSAFSSRGIVSKMSLDVPSSAPPEVKQQVDTIANSLKQANVVLPEEAVGTGAEWRVVATLSMPFGLVEQTTNYKLLGKKGTKIDLSATVAMKLKSKAATLPGLPPGADVKFKAFQGSGSGTTTMDLATGVAEGTVKSAVSTQMETQGKAFEMHLNTDMRFLPPSKAKKGAKKGKAKGPRK
ncbi:MAG: hypothetical protein KC416_10930 [Myxococcales bacterium]|nr:hypothetical protein [Myxococcales bacterium]